MAKKQPLNDLTVQAKDCYNPAKYTLVHNDYLRRLRSRRAVDGDWTELAQRIAARVGRAEAWREVLSEITGELITAADDKQAVAKDSAAPSLDSQPVVRGVENTEHD